MRAYATILDGDLDILPFFVRYRKLKMCCDEIFVIVYGERDHMHKALAIIRNEGLKAIEGPIKLPASFGARKRDTMIAEIHGNLGWGLFSDLDEFPEIDITKAIKRAERIGEPYVAGRWLDRVGEHGNLMAISQDQTLEKQFPMGSRIRQHLGLNADVFIAAPTGPLIHHPGTGNNGFDKKAWSNVRKYNVHHFKWQVNVVKRMRIRSRRFPAYRKRIRKMLTYIDRHNGVCKRHLFPIGNKLGI